MRFRAESGRRGREGAATMRLPAAGGDASAIGSEAMHMQMHRADSAMSDCEEAEEDAEEKERGRACATGRGGDMADLAPWRPAC